MSKVIGVNIESEITWHVVGDGIYDTLCGIDANDSRVGHMGTVIADHGTKVNCKQCKSIFVRMRELRLKITDFE